LNGVTALIGGVVQLDQDLKSIQAVSLSTDKQMESLAGSIERVALNTKFSNAEIADAVRTLVQAGTAAEDINAVVQATANFASATNSSLQVAADLITSARSVFDDLSDNTIANQLTSAVNISKLQADDLQTIVSLGAQVANSYKITSDQFLAAVSTLRNVGIKPSTVATGLRQAMLEVFSPDEKTIEVMRSRYQALGEEMSAEAIRSRFSGFTETDNPMVSALGELKRLGFAGEAQQDFARNFDVRAYNPLLALVKNYDQLLANEAKITFGAPAAEAAAIQMEALTAKVENLGGAITALAASMSGGLVKGIGKAVDAATSGIESLRKARAEGVTGIATPGESPLASTVAKAANYAFDTNKNVIPGVGQAKVAYDVVSYLAKGDKEKRAEKSAEVSAQLNYQLEETLAKIQTFEEAASAFDVNAARAGEAAGKSSEALLGASDAVARMEQGISELFGDTLPEVNKQLLASAAEYSNMGIPQRKAKFEEMKLKTPELDQFSFSQFELLSGRDVFGNAGDLGSLQRHRRQSPGQIRRRTHRSGCTGSCLPATV
jgi:TP901 family phage tail tape measure protein